MTSARYNKGPLEAQPASQVKEDFKNQVGRYLFGENAYLDLNFLQALGTLKDKGLAAKGLQLIQLDGEV